MIVCSYRGTTIQLTATGQFVCTLNGKGMNATSLKQLQNKIDKAQSFKPFPVLVVDSQHAVEMRVTGVGKPVSQYASVVKGKAFLLTPTDPTLSMHNLMRSTTRCILDTPEARAAIDEFRETKASLDAESKRIHELRYQAEKKYEAALTFYSMHDYNNGVPVPVKGE
jgi:hypothetical protein